MELFSRITLRMDYPVWGLYELIMTVKKKSLAIGCAWCTCAPQLKWQLYFLKHLGSVFDVCKLLEIGHLEWTRYIRHSIKVSVWSNLPEISTIGRMLYVHWMWRVNSCTCMDMCTQMEYIVSTWEWDARKEGWLSNYEPNLMDWSCQWNLLSAGGSSWKTAVECALVACWIACCPISSKKVLWLPMAGKWRNNAIWHPGYNFYFFFKKKSPPKDLRQALPVSSKGMPFSPPYWGCLFKALG